MPATLQPPTHTQPRPQSLRLRVSAPAPHAAPLMLHMPVDVRNLSLALLALFASVALLHWASAVLIPIMLTSLLLTIALRPAVETMAR